MTLIRAFVGHSFTIEDAPVVRAFTDYLTELQNTMPSFSWRHAERAEPTTLTEKVLGIARDQNLFIGICTSKEVVAPMNELSRAWPYSAYSKVKAALCGTKTSDWIIQEIGMAIGMGMKTILLVEKGLRTPGGLQGNTEYIEFRREAPTEAFTKLLQMISAATPKESNTLITANVENSTVAGGDEIEVTSIAVSEPSPTTTEDFMNPSSDWDRRTFEFASFKAINKKDDDTLERIDKAYQKTQSASIEGNLESWLAHIEWARIRFNHFGNLDRLIELAEANPKNSAVKQALARAYGFFNEYTLSAETYVAASDAVMNDALRKATLLRLAAEQYLKDNALADAKHIAETLRLSSQDAVGCELMLLQALSSIARRMNDDRLQIAALERILELTPDDINSRFMLALKQDAIGNEDLALRNYLQIPDNERGAGAWNNIGVQYDRHSLPVKAVAAFTRAADLGETLAMSSLGSRFLGQGFLDLAKEQCEKALQNRERHRNVGDLMSKIAETPDEEQKRLDEIISISKPKRDFYKLIGRAVVIPDVTPVVLHNVWTGPDCILAATKTGEVVKFEGTFERDHIALGGLLSAIGGPLSNPPLKRKHDVCYIGHFEGAVFFGKVSRKAEGESLLSSSAADDEVIMAMSVGGEKLEVMEAPRTAPKFYQLSRVRGLATPPDGQG